MARTNSGPASEKKSHVAAIAGVVGLLVAITTLILNIEKIAPLIPGPISVTAGTMTCERQALTLQLTNNGRRSVAIDSVIMSVLRNGVGEMHSIKVTAVPAAIDAGKATTVTLTASSGGIPIEFPSGDQCRLELSFNLSSGKKTSRVVAPCDCPS